MQNGQRKERQNRLDKKGSIRTRLDGAEQYQKRKPSAETDSERENRPKKDYLSKK